jgi:hypothetical protein
MILLTESQKILVLYYTLRQLPTLYDGNIRRVVAALDMADAV